jgi:hypothetical protein
MTKPKCRRSRIRLDKRVENLYFFVDIKKLIKLLYMSFSRSTSGLCIFFSKCIYKSFGLDVCDDCLD